MWKFEIFYHPWVLVLLLFVPMLWWLLSRRAASGCLRFSSFREISRVRRSWRLRLSWLPKLVRVICIVLLILALARPRQGSKQHKRTTKGVVMELVVDRSGSMNQPMDYYGQQLTRLEVVKRVLHDFVMGGGKLKGRPDDMMGLITFARFAETSCPLVLAHDALLGFLDKVDVPKTRNEDGTAIGEALACAGARLQTAEKSITDRNKKLLAAADIQADQKVKPEFEIQSKVIVLLTDGIQNAGQYTPKEAVELARKWGITIYTIGIGGNASRQNIFGMLQGPQLDERLLNEIAKQTGGFYGRADDAQALQKICEKIDQQEKTEIESIEFNLYDEQFGLLATAGLMALMLEMVLACTVFRKIP